jgi:hypothetical protein
MATPGSIRHQGADYHHGILARIGYERHERGIQCVISVPDVRIRTSVGKYHFQTKHVASFDDARKRERRRLQLQQWLFSIFDNRLQ